MAKHVHERLCAGTLVRWHLPGLRSRNEKTRQKHLPSKSVASKRFILGSLSHHHVGLGELNLVVGQPPSLQVRRTWDIENHRIWMHIFGERKNTFHLCPLDIRL